MHARVGVYQVRPGQLQQAVSVITETVAPAMRRQPGFQGILLLADEKASRIMSISTWDSEEAMRVAEGSGGYFQDALVRLGPLFIGSPVVEHYDVEVQA
ncbi:MAG TPA: antibiotic biosynthesis monooxygenase family protein [Dehalococcoidia bacterium]|nr:antibiotic biosynthesis monooxygenase family protein [Dehalococcoidia bacterium]